MERSLRLRVGAVLLGGLALTAFVVWALLQATSERDRRTFEADVRAAQDAIVDRVGTSIALLRGAAGLFASQGTRVTAESFRAYMERVALREYYPGILGIGFSRRLDPGERAALEREMRAQGQEGFRVWPDHEREEMHSIVFLEPLDKRNRAAIGYDMYTQETRRAAMARARDQGRAAASGVVELVQEIDEQKQPGFLIYLPVYRGGAIPASVEARREALLGFAYSPIRAGDFLSSAFSAEAEPRVPFAVFHGRAAGGVELYQHGGPLPAHPRFALSHTIDVAGEPWTFVFRAEPAGVQALLLPLFAGVAGALLSALLATLLWREARARGVIQSALEREQAARTQAERANRMKDEFLATLSHELRTPLNAIVGWAAILRRGGLSEAEVRGGLDVVDRNARAQARLIDDLLDMNRIISGKLGMSLQPTELGAVLRDALAAVAQPAQAKGLVLEERIAAEPLTVYGDPARLQQVIWNLLSNAIKFTPQGGRIEVALERAGLGARLSVADNGEGIDPRFLGQIFDRFAQADGSSTRRHGGLGLGLAIVRELVALQGGAVRAQSEGAGKGARFTVELPLMAPGSVAAAPEPPAAPAARLEGLKVLVVDDEADACELVRVALEHRGAQVRCARSAPEALELAERFRPDVLLSDIGMPGMNGYDLMRRVRGLAPQRGGAVRAAAFTAFAREEDRQEAARAGFEAHVAKPVQIEELVTVVAKLGAR